VCGAASLRHQPYLVGLRSVQRAYFFCRFERGAIVAPDEQTAREWLQLFPGRPREQPRPTCRMISRPYGTFSTVSRALRQGGLAPIVQPLTRRRANSASTRPN
jgi:hypothetical protein